MLNLTHDEMQLIATALNALPTSLAGPERQRYAMSCMIVDKIQIEVERQNAEKQNSVDVAPVDETKDQVVEGENRPN